VAWPTDALEDWERALSAAARSAVDDAAQDVRRRWPGLAVETATPSATPALALEEASRASSLVVVGAHGGGVLGRLVLGSVSRSVLHHAACPVAVVRSRPE
jgi:nucleotide-binding universal stress UspA family protein